MKHDSYILAACLTLATTPALSDHHELVLKEAFSGAFLVGAAVSRDQIMGNDPDAMELAARQFNTLTAENVMKWEKIEPSENQFDWDAPDRLVDYAEKHDMEVAGHVLVWHQQTPDWVFQDGNGGPASREQLLARMKNHIETVAGRYRGRVQSWEVVNEALNEDGTLRSTPWLEIIGEDYIEKAFEFAHQADPTAKLYYNDYNLFKPEKAAGARKLIQSLRDRGLVVHGAGMQGHYGWDNPADIGDFKAALSGFADLGLEVYITELDVSVLPFPDPENWGADISLNMELNAKYNPYPDGLPDKMAQKQAQQYKKLFEVILDHKVSVGRVTFWGINDGHSWKNGWPMEGRTDYPLLFDRDNKPKAVFYEVIGLAQEDDEIFY